MTFWRGQQINRWLWCVFAVPSLAWAASGGDTAVEASADHHSAGTQTGRAGDAIVAPAKPTHPRLLLTSRQLPAFRSRVQRSLRLGPAWQYIQNAANGMLDATPPGEDYARAGEGRHGNDCTVAQWYYRHLGNVAFAAFVTGDERLTAKGVDLLMAACAHDRWSSALSEDGRQVGSRQPAGLDTARMTIAVATAYDLLYPQLTDEQRTRVRQALVRNGIRPLMQGWEVDAGGASAEQGQPSTSNATMVCAGSAGVAALAVLGEEPEATQWVQIARDYTRAWLRDRGNDWFADAASTRDQPASAPESGPVDAAPDLNGGRGNRTACLHDAVWAVCCFADGLSRQTGEDLFELVPRDVLEQTAWTLMAWPESSGARRTSEGASYAGEGASSHGVRSSLMALGDCGASDAFPLLYAAMTRHRRDALAAWLCARVAPIPRDIRELVWLDENVPADTPDTAIPMRAFPGIGQVAMRNGWGPNTPAGAITFRQNRDHLDLGTFCLFGCGQPTLVESGSPACGSVIQDKYSPQSMAHNLVLVDGKSQAPADGQLLAAVGTSRITAASVQLAAAYPGTLTSWTRDLIMLPGGLAIVLDRLEANEPHRFDYVLHPYGAFRMPFPNASPGELLIGPEQSSTRIKLNSEAPFTVSQQDGFYLQTPQKYVRFDSPEPAKTRTYLMTCQWPTRSPTTRPVDVTPLAEGRWQVRRVAEDWRLMIRTGADASISSSTDARLVAVWDQGARSRERHALVLGGRRLGVDSRELMGATRPVHAAIEFGRPLYAHVWAGEPTRLSLAVEPGADNVFVNGKPVDAQHRGGHVLVDLSAGETHLVVSELSRYLPRPRSIVFDDLLAVSATVDAPAFQPGVIVRSSSCMSEGLLAVDGDANTGWSALPGTPMPQWLEVTLPAAKTISSIRLESGCPCKGHVEIWDPAKNEYASRGSFSTTADALSAIVGFDSVQTNRIKIVVEEVAPPADTASIDTLEWK
jgi:hypothetical protein